MLVYLSASGAIAGHSAPGTTTVPILDGQVRMPLGDEPADVSAGRLLALDGRVRHSIEAIEVSILLLALAQASPEDRRCTPCRADGRPLTPPAAGRSVSYLGDTHDTPIVGNPEADESLAGKTVPCSWVSVTGFIADAQGQPGSRLD